MDALALHALVGGAHLSVVAVGVFSTAFEALGLVDAGEVHAQVGGAGDPVVTLA